MAAYYPPFDNELKQGPPGPSGIGFKLANDGNYDMEDKILKNCKNPIDDQDVSTKQFVSNELDNIYQSLKKAIESSKSNIDASFLSFVNETSKRIQELDKALRTEMNDKCVYSHDGKIFDAKNKRIGNIKAPTHGRNAVNKEYFEKNALVLNNDFYDAQQKRISNVLSPLTPYDVVNKKYVDNIKFYAVTKQKIKVGDNSVLEKIIFDKFTPSDFIAPENGSIKFYRNMEIKLVFFLQMMDWRNNNSEAKIKITINNETMLDEDYKPILNFYYVNIHDVITINIKPEKNSTFLPVLKIEEIKFLE